MSSTPAPPPEDKTLQSAGSEDEAEPDLAPGTRVGEYEIQSKLGEGGFGAVYRATHPIIGKAAAIKVLNQRYSSNPEMVSRFVAEARAVNQIQSRNIVDIFAFGALPDGRQYFVMELLEGAPLDEVLRRRGRLPLEEAVPIVRGVARALSAAHAAGIAHRDLKPENVFICDSDDGEPYAKLIDFGIAKLLGDAAALVHKTRTGAPIGTPLYMSPEQCRGRGVDHRTDIYSLGIVIHVMLTGKRPFDGDTAMDVLMKQVTDPPPRMSQAAPDLPPELDEPVLMMLEKDADRRPQTVQAAMEGFEAAVAGRAPPARSSYSIPPRAAAAVAAGQELTPELLAIGNERTVTIKPASTGSSTLTPALSRTGPSASAPPRAKARSPRSRVSLLALGATAVGIAITVVATRRAVTMGGPLRSPSVTMGGPERSPQPPPVASTVPPSSASASAAVAMVQIQFDATPDPVDVYRGETKIGSSKGPIALQRGSEKVKLTFKAPGYLPADVEVVPEEGARVTVQLEKESKAPSAARPAPTAPRPAPRPKPHGGDRSEVVF